MRAEKYQASVPLTNQAVNARSLRYPLLSLTNQPADGIANGASQPENRAETLSASETIGAYASGRWVCAETMLVSILKRIDESAVV